MNSKPSDMTQAQRDAHVEALLREQFGRGSAADVISPEQRIRSALAPLVRAGVFKGMSEEQARIAVEAAVRGLGLPAVEAPR